MTEEEMGGPISFWGYKKQESNLILPEHDDDYDTLCVYFVDVSFTDITNLWLGI